MSMQKRWVDREITNVNRQHRRYQKRVGTTVQWYEFDPSSSTVDPVYDEAGEKVYLDPKTIRVMNLQLEEGMENPDPEGLHLMDSIHLLLNKAQVVADGLSDPDNADKHVKDRFRWGGRLWDVRTYQPAGRVREFIIEYAVDAVSYYVEETVNDPQFD